MTARAVALRAALVRAALVCAALLGACGAATAIRTDLEAQGELVLLSGTVYVEDWNGAPIVAAVLEVPDDPRRPFLVGDYQILDRPGQTYSFLVPALRYRIVAFEDTSRDLEYTNDERVAPWNEFHDLVTEPGSRHPGLDLTLAGPPPLGEEMPAYLGPSGAERSLWVGDVVPLEDARFDAESGRMGMLEPLQFTRDVGSGIFLLQPYEPDRIPVLFVHGIAGNPQEFTELVAGLDRGRFQPWVMQYASGFSLEMVTRYADRALDELVAIHRPAAICVVAHSMGGVVMREALGLFAEGSGRTTTVPLFVTLASPVGGHPAAAAGAHAPIVLPVWRSMVPDGPFITSLYRRHLPGETRYDLFVALGTDGGETDGVVPVASQLRPEARTEAALERSFVDTHTGILRDPEVAALLHEELARYCVPDARVGARVPTVHSPATTLAEDVGCGTPWHLDPARGEHTITCRTEGGDEISTDCEACELREDEGACFADLPGETIERRAPDGTHHTFPASHVCAAACCQRDRLTPLPPRSDR